jgi:hypothetical protein
MAKTAHSALAVLILAAACARADGGESRTAVPVENSVPAPREASVDTPPPLDTGRVDTASRVVPWVPDGTQEPPSQRWTAGVVAKKGGQGIVTLTSVRTAKNAGFDRVVFEFEGGKRPGYHVEYIDRPVRQCGSGAVVPMTGQGWLRVRFEHTQAHTDAGISTIVARKMSPGLPVLQELAMTCDFEGQVEWVLAVTRPNRYRVLELSDPARVVVDVLQ